MKSQASREPGAGLQPTLAYTPPTSDKRASKHAVNLTTGSTPNFTEEIGRLLRSRLRAVAMCVAGATAVYILIGWPIRSSGPYQSHRLVVQIAAIVMFGGAFAFLSSGVRLT